MVHVGLMVDICMVLAVRIPPAGQIRDGIQTQVITAFDNVFSQVRREVLVPVLVTVQAPVQEAVGMENNF